MFFWGPFGHQNNHEKIEKINDLPNRFAWTEVRRDDAYPVFTNATSDSVSPWPPSFGPCPADAPAGQINGFFRWSAEQDTPSKLVMILRLASSEELHSQIFTIPTESTADVSFRRLQEFRVNPDETVAWSFGDLSGQAVADEEGVVTIPRLPITVEPKTIVLAKVPE